MSWSSTDRSCGIGDIEPMASPGDVVADPDAELMFLLQNNLCLYSTDRPSRLRYFVYTRLHPENWV